MGMDLPPNWTANHDQIEAELRDLVKPIVTSMLTVRDAEPEEAMAEGLRLAETLAEHLAPLPSARVMELLFLALSKVAHNALEKYDERMEALLEQAREHARGEHDAGRDADGAEEREWGGTEPAPEA